MEQLPARHEDLGLCGKVGAAGLDDVDDGQTVLPCDGHTAKHLAERVRVRCAAANGRVVGDDHRLNALDNADPDHHAATDGELTAPSRERAQFEKRRVEVEQKLDTLADEQLAPAAMSRNVFGPTACVGQRQLLCDGVELRTQPVAVLEVAGRRVVDSIG
jgi:hypothetical protein